MKKSLLNLPVALLSGLLAVSPGIAAPTAPTTPNIAPIASPRAPTVPQVAPLSKDSTQNKKTDPLAGLINHLANLEASQNQPASAPVIGSADNNGGYGAKVLEKVLPYWQPPAGVSGVVTVSLRVGSDGRPLYCEPVKRSGNPQLDDLPCEAALRAGSFGNPPYGIVTEVFLTLATDRAALGTKAAPATPQRSYAEEIMYRVRPHVKVPSGLGGASLSVELLLRLTPAGNVESMSVARSSGRADVDNAVLAAMLAPDVLPPLPEGGPPQELRLLFTVTGN